LPPVELIVECIESQPFGQNSYVAHAAAGNDCVIVDPGMEPDLIVDYVRENRLRPAAILITHAHGDHIAGIPAMKQKWPDCPVVIGREEAPKLQDPWQNLSGQFGFPIVLPPAEVLLDDGDTYEIAGLTFEIAQIPGHSSGHIVFIWRESDTPVVFGGDVLFQGSIGRTDFPDGSFAKLEQGIKHKLYTLPDDTIIYSGHGPATTIGREKRTNPFVRE